MHFELDSSYSSKDTTTTATTQPIIRGNHGIPSTTDLPGATPFLMLKIDDRYPDEWNGIDPVEYTKQMTFFLMLKIDDRYPDEWNGNGPTEYAEILMTFFTLIKIDDRFPDEWNGYCPFTHAEKQ